MASTTKARLETAAMNRFRIQGYNGTGIKQIVTDAGAPFASLYHFFPGGKQELAESTIRTSGRMFEELVVAIWDAAPSLRESVSDIFAGAAAVLEATDYEDACPIAVVALEVASTNEALRKETADVFERWTAAAVTRLKDSGIPARHARDAATAIISLLEGGFLLSRAAKDTAPMLACGRAAQQVVAAALARQKR